MDQNLLSAHFQLEETQEQIEQLVESIANYKKWRRQQQLIFGAEQMLEAERSKKDDKNRFKSINQKYVPTSLNEIQAGFDLDIAKQSKVSFDPDIEYDDDYEETEINGRAVKKQTSVAENGGTKNGAENEVGTMKLTLSYCLLYVN